MSAINLVQRPGAYYQLRRNYLLVTAANTNVNPVSSTPIWARSIKLWGFKSVTDATGAGTNNTGAVTVGYEKADGSATYFLPDSIAAGGSLDLSLPDGQAINLAKLFFKNASSGDGLAVIYS